MQISCFFLSGISFRFRSLGNPNQKKTKLSATRSASTFSLSVVFLLCNSLLLWILFLYFCYYYYYYQCILFLLLFYFLLYSVLLFMLCCASFYFALTFISVVFFFWFHSLKYSPLVAKALLVNYTWVTTSSSSSSSSSFIGMICIHFWNLTQVFASFSTLSGCHHYRK